MFLSCASANSAAMSYCLEHRISITVSGTLCPVLYEALKSITGRHYRLALAHLTINQPTMSVVATFKKAS